MFLDKKFQKLYCYVEAFRKNMKVTYIMIKSTKQEYLLTAENIDQMSEYVQECLQSLKMEETNILRIRLSMEEMLLKWQDHFG